MFGISGKATQSNNQNIQFTWKVNNLSSDCFNSLPVAASDAKGSMFFKSDGTKLYRAVAPQGSDKYLYSYDLSTPWDLTGAVTPSATKILPLGNINIYYITSRALFFSDDGTKIFVPFDTTIGVPGGDTAGIINRYDLSTAWDITTATYSNKFKYIECNGLFFKSDGLRMYVSGPTPIKDNSAGSSTIKQYTLGSAWDITTTTLDYTLTVSSNTSDRLGNVVFSPDGLNLYVTVMKNAYTTTVSNTIKKYTLSSAWDLSTATFANQLDLNFLYNYYPVGLSFNSTGTRMFVSPVGPIGVTEKSFILTFDLNVAWDITTATVTYTSGVGYKFVGSNITPNRGLEFDSTGSNFYVCSTNSIAQYSTSNMWDVNNSSFVSTYDITAQSNNLQSIRLSSNNSKLYLLSSNTTVTKVLDYTLSVPSDLSTAVYNQSKTITSEYPLGGATGLEFSPDGTKMLIGSSTLLRKYDLSTAWDISTAVANTSTFSYGGYNVGTSNGIKMKPDGKKLIISSISDYKLLSFDLSTAWDLSTGNTATVSYTFSSNNFYLCGDDIQSKPNGGKLFTINGAGYVLSHSLK